MAKACATLDHLLMRPDGFTIYCDHRNLVYMFRPDQDIKKHIRGKLLRWGLQLSQYRYRLEHVAGEFNVVADMFSRWGGPKSPAVTKAPMTSPAKPVTISTKIALSTAQKQAIRKTLKRFTRQTNRRPAKTELRALSLNLHPLEDLAWPDVEAIVQVE